MKVKKEVSVLVFSIIIFSLFASAYGLFSTQGPGQHEFESIHGETVSIYGKGLYRNESVTMAAQAKGQDIVTLLFGIPLLIISIILARKDLIKGRLLLAGTLGYFLYTYASYSFLAMYNPLFLIYVVLFSTSFFAFTLTMMSFDIEKLGLYFKAKTPVKFLGSFLIFLGFSIGLLWLGRIMNPLMSGIAPPELGHYTTLVIQALDLGFVVPVAILAGILLIRRKPFGYLLASVIIIKGITMLTAITAMAIGMIRAGEPIVIMELILFPAFNLVTIFAMYLIMKNVQEPEVN